MKEHLTDDELIIKIKKLAKQKNRIIFAHTYQIPEIQNLADMTGDSYFLSRQATEIENQEIIMCGVYFMAESIKILSPEKRVFIPNNDAGCPMADMITIKQLRKLKEEYPGYKVVCYVNSSAEVKAESDVCCTSANALNIVNNIDADNIIFVPDRMLGSYIKTSSKKNIILYDGFCPVHQRFDINKISKMKEETGRILLVHGETDPKLQKIANYVFSTSGMINYVRDHPAEEYIICTEEGIKTQLLKYIPEAQFTIFSDVLCKNMKKITLLNLYESLEYDRYEVTVDETIRKNAYKSLKKMLELSIKP